MSIPKIIHYCWFGRNSIPEKDRHCIESWKKFCPDYEIIEWNEDNYDVTKVPYMKEAYDARKWSFVSDYARMDIIYNHGGIYLDTDVELLQPLGILLEYAGFMGVEKGTNHIALGLGFGSEKGMPLWKEMCLLYQKKHFTKEDGSFNLSPIPRIVTEYLLEKYDFSADGRHVQDFQGILVLPHEYLCPQDFTTGKTIITPNTLAIHHYHASWQTEEEKADARTYKKFTDVFGPRWGELIYQICQTCRKRGIWFAIKKVFRYIWGCSRC